MKSLELLKPTVAIALAIVLVWLLSVRPAQAGYVVKLQQVGPDVVATGSGAINLTGLTFVSHSPFSLTPVIVPSGAFIRGPFSRLDFLLRGQRTDEFSGAGVRRLPAVAAATWSG